MSRTAKVKRARPSGVQLDHRDAAIAKGMIARGDRQHDIAAWFGVNGGRIAEIATGDAWDWVEAADASELPPPGPYPGYRKAAEATKALDAALDALAKAEAAVAALRP